MPRGASKPMRAFPLQTARKGATVNHMVQYIGARLDASFAALSDATRRGVLAQLGCADASITDLADKFRMTLTGMKKHVGVLGAGRARHHREGRARADLQAGPASAGGRGDVDREVPPALGRTVHGLDQVVEELKRKERVNERRKK